MGKKTKARLAAAAAAVGGGIDVPDREPRAPAPSVKALKALLKPKGLPLYGNKKTLMHRLEAAEALEAAQADQHSPPDDAVAHDAAAEALAAAAAQAVAAPLVPAVAPAAVSAGAASDVARKRTRDDAGSTDDDDDDDEEDDDDASELDDASVVDFADVNADRAEGTYFAEEKNPQFLVSRLYSVYAVQGRLKSQHATKLKQAIYDALDEIITLCNAHKPPLVARA